jgi:hypothetical protein
MGLKQTEFANIKGKQHPTYHGVLRVAIEEKGLISLSEEITHLMETPNGWYALAKATAVFRDTEGVERTFTGIGDCGPHNCDKMIAIHAPRMAGTRAKGRVLRDALGLDECLAEEMHEGPASAPRHNGHAPAAQPEPEVGYTGKGSDHPDGPRVIDVLSEVAERREKRKAQPAPEPIACVDCDRKIEDPKGLLSPASVATIAIQKFGRELCVVCGKAQAEAEKARVPTGQVVG